jgi:Alpha-L-fucosidase
MRLLSISVLLLFGWEDCLLGRPAEGALVRSSSAETTPSWDELDARPLPTWYDQAKLGIFIHWGVFAVPSYGSEWFWAYWKDMNPHVYGGFVNATERPGFSYQEYASRFTAELYRPEEWAQAFAKAGAQYVVLTSKHHEGFCTSALTRRLSMSTVGVLIVLTFLLCRNHRQLGLERCSYDLELERHGHWTQA